MTMTQTTHYRVIEILTNDFGMHNHGHSSKVDETIKWSGTDIKKLSRQYPPSNIFGADPLGHSEIEDGLIRYDYRFECQTEDGSWEKIDDPRRRITPMTSLEREIDAENRRDFPGDYITSDCERCGDYGCDECEDPDRVDCTSCDDYGCARCDPNWCTTCDNNGCATCDPASVCSSCKNYCHSQYESLNKDSGLCQSCEYIASLRYCEDCQTELQKSEEGNLCTNCEYYRSHPFCSNDCHEVADGDDGLCSGCRYDAATKCSDCDYDLPDGDDGLCNNCRRYDADMRRYYVWWRRALRKLRIMG
jgi:hypothetical protein